MRPIWISTIALAVIGFATSAEAQELAKSGKFTGKYASHQVPEVAQTYELEKGHVFFLGRSHGVFLNDVADGFLDKSEVTCALGGYGGTNGNFVLVARRRCKADCACQPVEGSGESLIEAIEPRALL